LAFRTELGPEQDLTQGSDTESYSTSYSDLVGGQGGLTALLHAVREGHRDVAMALVRGGADLDRVSGGDGTSPLLMATINGHYDLALELLAAGAGPDLASRAGAAPLYAALNAHWAPKARYPQQGAYRNQEATYLDVMRALLEAGADPNRRLRQHLWYMEYTFSHLGVDTRGATPFWRAAHALDVEAMRLLVEFGAEAGVPTVRPPARRASGGGSAGTDEAPLDPSGLLPVPDGGPGVFPIHAATGHGYGTGYAGNSHRHVPEGWMEAVRYLVEEHGADVDARDHDGASRGDVEMIRYLVDKGADVKAVSRRGQTTADMANGPQQRIQPFPEAIRLLVSLGAINNGNCRSCVP
jgi:ankyrin repeat protein